VAFLLAADAVAVFIVGLWVGIREGSKLVLIEEHPGQGVIMLLILDISKDATRPDHIPNDLELYVDQGLVGAYNYLNSPLRPFLESPVRPDLGPIWAGTPSAHIEEFATKLANYRKAHPSPVPAYMAEWMPAPPNEFGEKMEKRRREDTRIIDLMVKRYASQ